MIGDSEHALSMAWHSRYQCGRAGNCIQNNWRIPMHRQAASLQRSRARAGRCFGTSDPVHVGGLCQIDHRVLTRQMTLRAAGFAGSSRGVFALKR